VGAPGTIVDEAENADSSMHGLDGSGDATPTPPGGRGPGPRGLQPSVRCEDPLGPYSPRVVAGAALVVGSGNGSSSSSNGRPGRRPPPLTVRLTFLPVLLVPGCADPATHASSQEETEDRIDRQP
jgi:hypothetical protein